MKATAALEALPGIRSNDSAEKIHGPTSGDAGILLALTGACFRLNRLAQFSLGGTSHFLFHFLEGTAFYRLSLYTLGLRILESFEDLAHRSRPFRVLGILALS